MSNRTTPVLAEPAETDCHRIYDKSSLWPWPSHVIYKWERGNIVFISPITLNLIRSFPQSGIVRRGIFWWSFSKKGCHTDVNFYLNCKKSKFAVDIPFTFRPYFYLTCKLTANYCPNPFDAGIDAWTLVFVNVCGISMVGWYRRGRIDGWSVFLFRVGMFGNGIFIFILSSRERGEGGV